MSTKATDLTLLKMCRAEYVRLARHVQRWGISPAGVEQSVQEFTEIRDGCAWVRPIAYAPTGVGLGCPLPDKRISRLLWQISQITESQLECWATPSIPTFAFVPPESYHITVLNRSHYEVSNVFPMTPDEFSQVQAVVARLSLGNISVLTCGLVLTSSGKLFVKCLPVDDRILTLRKYLVSEIPFLGANMPRMIHIKLGHILVPLNRSQARELIAWLQRLDQQVIGQLEFTDLYTPIGRIEIQ